MKNSKQSKRRHTWGSVVIFLCLVEAVLWQHDAQEKETSRHNGPHKHNLLKATRQECDSGRTCNILLAHQSHVA